MLLAGWLAGLPVPLLLMWAPAWSWIVVANVLLGVNQGLAWSVMAITKIGLAGREQAIRQRIGGQSNSRIGRPERVGPARSTPGQVGGRTGRVPAGQARDHHNWIATGTRFG